MAFLFEELCEGKADGLKALSDAEFALVIAAQVNMQAGGLLLCDTCVRGIRREILRRFIEKAWLPDVAAPAAQHES